MIRTLLVIGLLNITLASWGYDYSCGYGCSCSAPMNINNYIIRKPTNSSVNSIPPITRPRINTQPAMYTIYRPGDKPMMCVPGPGDGGITCF